MMDSFEYNKEGYRVILNSWGKNQTRVRIDVDNNDYKFMFEIVKWVMKNTKDKTETALVGPLYFTFDKDDLMLFKLMWC